MVGKSTKHMRGSNCQNTRSMSQCTTIVAARLDGSLHAPIEILQMRQFFQPGLDLNVLPLGTKEALQAQQCAKLKDRQSQLPCALDRVAKISNPPAARPPSQHRQVCSLANDTVVLCATARQFRSDNDET